MLPHVPLYRTTQKPPITCESKEHPTNMFPPLVMPHVSGLCQPPSWRRGNVSNIVAQVRGEARYRTREKLGGKRKTQRSSAGRPKFPVPGSTIPPGWEMTRYPDRKVIPRRMGGKQVANPGWASPWEMEISLSLSRRLPCTSGRNPKLRDVSRNTTFLFRVTSIVGHKSREVSKCTTSVGPAAETEACGRNTGRQGDGIRTRAS